LLLDGPGTGSALDTRRAASQFADLGCRVVVTLGGDGTCRDVAIGWPDVTMIPISTGTNNVFPAFVDGSSAGAAAGLVASGRIEAGEVARRSKRLVAVITGSDGAAGEEIALVDMALIDARHTGARAVVRASSVRAIVAAIASPATTGLSSIAGRVRPLGRDDDGAVVVRTGDDSTTSPTHVGASRRVRVPIVPGSFAEVTVLGFDLLADGDRVDFAGPAVLALDGERERVLGIDQVVTIHAERTGPSVVDVGRALVLAAERRLFDVTTTGQEAVHGD
jgi:hypothetical protein